MRAIKRSYLLLPIITLVFLATIANMAFAGVVWDGSGDPVASGFELNSVIPSEPDGVPPDPFYQDWCNGQSWTGIMYQDTSPWAVPGESAGSYRLPAASADAELVRANGWTVEARVEAKANTGDLFGLGLIAGDDVGGLGLLLLSNQIQVYDTSWASYPEPNATIPITFDYHDIRIQVAPGGTSGAIYVDDIATPAATVTLSTEAGAVCAFGDFSSSSAGVAHWDHVVVNDTAPAPTTPPQADGLDIDATFESGSLPTDFGMTAGGIDPLPNVSGGVWTNNRIAGEMSTFQSDELCRQITGSIVHGFAEIDQATLTGTADDQTIVGLGTDLTGSVSFTLGITDGTMSGYASSSVSGYGTAVANDDGDKHTYGWEVDLSTRMLKLFFDGLQVGEEDGYNVSGNFFGEELVYFGDASGGNDHSEVWSRWIITEGAYPVVVVPDIPGDANRDGVVDANDAVVLASNWQMQTGAEWGDGDFNGDGAVTDEDATILATNWQTATAGTSVPEPGTIVLLAGLVLGFILYRRGD